MAKTASNSFLVRNSSQKPPFCCFDVCSVRSPQIFQVQAKISTERPCFQTIFPFLMTMKKSGKMTLLTFFNSVDKIFLYCLYLMCASYFTRSFSLIHFDRNWFLKDIDICKKEVIHDLLLNFNLFSDTFFRGAQVSSKDSTFRKVLFDFSIFVLDESTKLSHSTEK